MLNARAMVPSHDVLIVTLDTLRYDVAVEALELGLTPNLAAVLPNGRWEQRHSPGTFTYASHQAFFAGFFPTPATPGFYPRPFAARFAGSETTTEETCVFESADIVTGFAELGYRTVCIGGVGFFNKQTALGSVLPGLFQHSVWRPEMGVTDARSTEHQVTYALRILEDLSPAQRVLVFLNVSALHQPNCMFVPGELRDSKRTMAGALAYVDGWLGRLFEAMGRRNPTLAVVCSDHGTAYGEDGYYGHRLAHPVVWTVPYGEFVLGDGR